GFEPATSGSGARATEARHRAACRASQLDHRAAALARRAPGGASPRPEPGADAGPAAPPAPRLISIRRTSALRALWKRPVRGAAGGAEVAPVVRAWLVIRLAWLPWH